MVLSAILAKYEKFNSPFYVSLLSGSQQILLIMIYELKIETLSFLFLVIFIHIYVV